MQILPFIIEFILDPILIHKGKKDIHWGLRIVMMIIVSCTGWNFNLNPLIFHFDLFVSCWIFYPLFDPALNLIRVRVFRHRISRNHLSKTKLWDRFIAGLNLHPTILMIVRVLMVLFIGWVAWQIK